MHVLRFDRIAYMSSQRRKVKTNFTAQKVLMQGKWIYRNRPVFGHWIFETKIMDFDFFKLAVLPIVNTKIYVNFFVVVTLNIFLITTF